ncbi:hypothetical protein BKA70DRAFT_1435725 [Coprinopsis sp. MPI-PUGE-AT-0042]|nr:hypothetical protein BKA70DRAFT_1435725 [Coprinopsis sp. MPI-PUGE-AT-0042]
MASHDLSFVLIELLGSLPCHGDTPIRLTGRSGVQKEAPLSPIRRSTFDVQREHSSTSANGLWLQQQHCLPRYKSVDNQKHGMAIVSVGKKHARSPAGENGWDSFGMTGWNQRKAQEMAERREMDNRIRNWSYDVAEYPPSNAFKTNRRGGGSTQAEHGTSIWQGTSR